ncbi:MAG: ATP-binding cassette domain-containing protein, partial [Clostridiales Family XIII bacterium]|nr:ATP-binding cassette domain-containing protein [Clostridiales Family XIII bacterium]
MAIIELENFGFTYAGTERSVLSSITLDVRGGEFVLVCGKSGCGKTTLLRNLKKEIAPVGKTEGAVRICGLAELTPRQSATLVGFVMQDPDNQIVMDSVWLELAFGLENLGIPSEEIGRRIGEISAFFGIDSWFGKKVEELSGGQKQILSLAAVIAMQAEIIVLDEPTAQLDPIAAKEFLHMLMRVNTELGKTVILSEHALEEVFSMSDKVLYMDGGEVKYFGDTKGFTLALAPDDNYYPALPSPARLAMRLDASSIPLDVREGRSWLLNYADLRSLRSRYDEAATVSPPKKPAEKIPFALRAKGIWFRYSAHDDFVLKGLDAEIAENSLHIFVGGNGSGKSTLLRVLAGVRKPFRGKVAAATGARVTMLSQDPKSVFVCEALREEFAEHASSVTAEGSAELIKRLGLESLLDRHPYDLSAGEM